MAEYRQSLRDVATLAERDLRGLWGGLDLANAESVSAALQDSLPALVDGYYTVAAVVAADWYDLMREQAAVRKRFDAIVAEPPEPERAQVLARWGTGPLFSASPAPETALALLAGGLTKVVLGGARDTVTRSAIADPSSRGWVRAVSSGACSYCHDLGGGGAVRSEASADFEAHDACQCSAIPDFG